LVSFIFLIFLQLGNVFGCWLAKVKKKLDVFRAFIVKKRLTIFPSPPGRVWLETYIRLGMGKSLTFFDSAVSSNFLKKAQYSGTASEAAWQHTLAWR
jgi:hypothetical protein